MAKSRKKYFAGIDIGGTKLLTAVFNRDFRVMASVKNKVEISKGRQNFLDSILESVEEALSEAGVKFKNLAGVGVGCPGIIDSRHGVVITSPNIPFLKKYPLRSKLSQKLHVPVIIENDVNAGLYGEFRLGAARKHRDIVGVFLGTGIGGALILNGKLYQGSSGSAGEIGHMIVDPLGPRCGCQQKGCLEAYAGRTAIAAEAAVLAARQQAPALFKAAGTEVLKIKSGVLAKSIAAGDEKIERLVREKGRLLGITLANISNLLNPELIVLGGGLTEALGGLLVKEVSQSLREHAMAPVAKQVKVVQSYLKDYAVASGAAKMAADILEKGKDG